MYDPSLCEHRRLGRFGTARGTLVPSCLRWHARRTLAHVRPSTPSKTMRVANPVLKAHSAWNSRALRFSTVTYRLSRLAPGSYDILLNGVIVGGLVRSTTGRHDVTWKAELLIAAPAAEMPSSFEGPDHNCPTLEAACAWL